MTTAPRRWPHNTLLDALDPAVGDRLVALGVRRAFDPGQFLIFEGDSTYSVFILLDGWAKVLGTAADGHTVLLSMRTAGDVVGELAALDGEPRSASVAAASSVLASVVGRDRFEDFVGADPAVAAALNRTMSLKIRLAARHHVHVSGAPVLRRLARVLEDLAQTYATARPDGLRIDVPLSRSDLASLVGAAPPSLYRALSYLRERGVLDSKGRIYTVRDLKALDAISRDADPDARERPPAAASAADREARDQDAAEDSLRGPLI
jgi:CRP/FNR family cyclic AMP-dependent transcriptional regulator